MAYDIFISYRRQGGAEKARPIKSELERRGYRVFLDFDELKDGVFDKRIMNAIDEAPIFLIILSANSLNRCCNHDDWVRKEIEYAVKKKKHFVPINPNKEFSGFPAGVPENIKRGLGLHQFSHIDFEQLFAVSMEKMISERIEPYLGDGRRIHRDNKALVRVATDLDCRVVRFGEEMTIAKAGQITEIRLPKGTHKLSFVPFDEKSIQEVMTYTITDIEFEGYIEIKLKERYNTLKAEQEQQRKAAEAAREKLKEQKFREESEKRRKEAEEERKKVEERKRIVEETARKRREMKEQRAKQLAEEKQLKAEIAKKQELKTLLEKGLMDYDQGLFSSAVQWFRIAAEQGLAGAQYWLGYCYQNGKGVDKNDDTAVLWYRNAAEQGDTNARYKLSKYDDIIRREKEQEDQKVAEQQRKQNLTEWLYKGSRFYNNSDYPAAVSWFRKAAQQGYDIAQFWLGYCYYNGHGVTKDYNIAVSLFRKAAQQGYDIAQYWLGYCYYNGHGVTKDYNIAVSWFRKAAQQGYDIAQYWLGSCYYNGHGVAKDCNIAVSWFRNAAQQGCGMAQHWLGYCYYNGHGVTKDYNIAVSWFRKAAQQGYDIAQFWLGYCYYNGHGVTKDYNIAVSWFRRAAQQGCGMAQHWLGYCYYNGHGVTKDYNIAVSWFRKAAQQGYNESQYWLGLCYAQGDGVEQNEKHAAEWFQKAAEQGFATAQYMLGLYFERGIGVAKDKEQAKMWYQAAAEHGDEDAKKALNKMNKGFLGKLFG